jgi:hypothetical protein
LADSEKPEKSREKLMSIKMKKLFLLLVATVFLTQGFAENKYKAPIYNHNSTTELNELEALYTNLFCNLQSLNTPENQSLIKLSSSNDIFEDLIELEANKKIVMIDFYLAYSAKLQRLLDIGIHVDQIENHIKATTVSILELDRPKSLNMDFTPCYNTWENTMVLATASYTVCAIGVGWTGAGLAACTITYAATVLATDALYEKCMGRYGSPNEQ